MLTEDYQFELPDFDWKFGCGTDWPVRRNPEVKGFIGSPPVKQFDLELAGFDGALPGQENYATRILTIPIRVANPTNPAAARATYQTVLDKWQLRRNDEVALDARIPGTPETVLRYYGRPREIQEQQVFHAAGLFEADLIFDATDPYGYGAEVALGPDTSSPLTFTNAGKITSSRAIINITTNGASTPAIVNTSDDDGDITATFAIDAGEDFTINLRNMSLITTETLLNFESFIRVDSRWFSVVPGENVLTFNGISSLSMTYRPAWL